MTERSFSLLVLELLASLHLLLVYLFIRRLMKKRETMSVSIALMAGTRLVHGLACTRPKECSA